MTELEHGLALLFSCVNATISDHTRKRFLASILAELGLIELGAADQMTADQLLGLAKQHVVAACGPDAWSAPE